MGLEPIVLYHSRRNGWVFPPYHAFSRSGWDFGDRDLRILRELEAQGGEWLVVPSFNSYTKASGRQQFQRQYPALYAGMVEDYDVVQDIPAKPANNNSIF